MARVHETTVDAPTRSWTENMREGDFEAAWRVSDRLLRERAGKPCPDWPRHCQYIWDGSPLADRHVLIRCYRGFGDIIQFARYVPLVAEIAREVTLWAPAPLLPLLKSLDGVDRLLPLHDGTPEVDYEVDVELMELAHVFRTTLDRIPADVPYLRAPAAKIPRSPGQLEVGLVWQAGEWDDRRNVPVAELALLASLPGVQCHLLQRGDAKHQWRFGGAIDSPSDHPAETAATMRALDLVVSVDTFTAHLAGALAVPVWTLLHADADWRWMTDREDSPWYPTMRLFRQPRAGDWASVSVHVADELTALAASLDVR